MQGILQQLKHNTRDIRTLRQNFFDTRKCLTNDYITSDSIQCICIQYNINNMWWILFLWIWCGMGSEFHTSDNVIYDRQGGVRIFHGVNLVVKEPPYWDESFGEDDLKKLKSWGLNGIRLGVMWAGVQPTQNEFNHTYLDKMVELVNLAGKYNIYTLVQFHQDLFSEKFCADGVPLWAIPPSVYDSFPRPLTLKKYPYDDKTGLPIGCGQFPWAQYYFSEAVNKGFGELWKKNSLLDKFGNYWKEVARAFKGNPYVIGFELVNEPWPGNLYQNPLVLVPGLSEKLHLQAAYDYLAEQIRSVDPTQNICFEGVTWLNSIQSGFTHPPGGFRHSNSSMFCYHYYSPPSVGVEKFMKARIKDTKKLKSAGVLSQFYIINEAGDKNVDLMEKCDENSHSWFGWLYNCGDRISKQVIRTFSHRVAGQIQEQSFSSKTKFYNLVYLHKNGTGNTIIVISQQHNYPNGYEVECHPKEKIKFEIQEQIYIVVRANEVKDGEKIMISIYPI